MNGRQIKPGAREWVGFNELFGETIDRVEHGSLHVNLTSLSGKSCYGGTDHRMITITTKSGREFVFTPQADVLELYEVGLPPKPVALVWSPIGGAARRRLGVLMKKMSDGSREQVKVDSGDEAMPLSVARKLAVGLGVKLEVLP